MRKIGNGKQRQNKTEGKMQKEEQLSGNGGWRGKSFCEISTLCPLILTYQN